MEIKKLIYFILFAVMGYFMLSMSAMAASYHPVNEKFVKQAEEFGVSQSAWDQAEYSAVSLPSAYKFTRYYQISHKSTDSKIPYVKPQQWSRTKSLDLSKLKGLDADGEHDLIVLLRDRLKNHTMVVLKDGQLVHQHFFNGMNQNSTHLDMSISKSFTSALASIAVSEGKLDMSKKVEYYLPQFKGTAFEGSTIQEVADMRSGLDIPTPKHKSWDPNFTLSQEWNGKNDSGLHGVKDYLVLIKNRKYPTGEAYQYQDPNTELLGMIVEKVTEKKLSDYLEEKIWQQVGAENDAYWMADPDGFVVASGGLNMTTRDLARIGQLILNNGKNYLGTQIIPKNFLDALWKGNKEVRSAWKKYKEAAISPNGWYKDQYRVLNIQGHKILVMVGIHGQILAMEKSSGVVIAMNGGYPQTETPRMINLAFFQIIPAILDALK